MGSSNDGSLKPRRPLAKLRFRVSSRDDGIATSHSTDTLGTVSVATSPLGTYDPDASRRAASKKAPLLHVARCFRSASTRYFEIGIGVLARPPTSSGLDVAALGVPRGGPARGIGVLVVRPQKTKKNRAGTRLPVPRPHEKKFTLPRATTA